MPKGDKYVDLTRFLSQCGQESIRMTFADLEQLCGLPSSAYRYPACWNNSSETSLSYGWLLAGYLTTECNLAQKWVIFAHDPEGAEDYLSRLALRERGRQGCEHHRQSHTTPAELVDICPLIRSATRFHQALTGDPHGRYRSWEYCYAAFQSRWSTTSDHEIDYLALHLAWYLASWGMLRGGAFLLQKDYKIHIPAVRLLLEPRWAPLRSLSRSDLMAGDFAQSVMELAQELKSVYEQTAGETPTDTLLTKILLGTVGCTPAYDRYFKWAVKETQTASPQFSKQSLQELGRLYAVHWDRLEVLRKTCTNAGVEYPPMKLLDMCFFQYGVDNQIET